MIPVGLLMLRAMEQGAVRVNQGSVSFRRVAETDFPMLRGWLVMPHVRRWWGKPEEEIRLIREGEATGESTGYIAFEDDVPVGYIQSWDPAIAGDEPWTSEMGPGELGVDIFIGPADRLGKGLGSRLVRAFAQKLLTEGAQRVVIDPDIGNTAAIRAYTSAGFRHIGTYKDAYVMAFEQSEKTT